MRRSSQDQVSQTPCAGDHRVGVAGSLVAEGRPQGLGPENYPPRLERGRLELRVGFAVVGQWCPLLIALLGQTEAG